MEGTFALLAAFSTTGQFLAGSFNWLHRYEAWLVALDGLALILIANVALAEQRKAFLKVILLMAVGCSTRAFASTTDTVLAAHDREWEHFGPTYALDGLPRQPVMVNDIGVMAYYGGLEAIDVYGLANNDAMKMRRKGDNFTPADVAGFARSQGAHVAELQVCWQDQFEHIPPGWRLVEAWIGPRNVVFGDRTVGFLADGRTSAAVLKQVLAQAPAPAGVVRLRDGDPRVSAFNAAADKAAGAKAVCPVLVPNFY